MGLILRYLQSLKAKIFKSLGSESQSDISSSKLGGTKKRVVYHQETALGGGAYYLNFFYLKKNDQ